MVKILLVCNLGMSTSMLVKKMLEEAEKRNLELKVDAVALSIAEKEYPNYQVILLGPQVRHCLTRLKEKVGNEVPVDIINMRDYGTMNGANVLDAALKIIEENQ